MSCFCPISLSSVSPEAPGKWREGRAMCDADAEKDFDYIEAAEEFMDEYADVFEELAG